MHLLIRLAFQSFSKVLGFWGFGVLGFWGFVDSWSGGKFAQATVGGLILGWVYVRYGFIVCLLIHWATNYFIFSYANFISQINSISIESAFNHSLMSSIEILFLVAGIVSVAVLFANRFLKSDKPLEV